MKEYQSQYEIWLGSDRLTDVERAELRVIACDEEAKELRFGAPMEFGTAGLRSTMYMGIGCMNRFTVAQTTRGIAALVHRAGGAERGVAIAYDSRNHSREFAEVSASILAAAGVRVYLFDDLRPTPELSFAVRELHAMAGINITASHNPKEYNGYKAYWEDGAQLAPEQAAIVSAERAKFDVLDTDGMDAYARGVADGTIVLLDAEFDEKYIRAVLDTAISKDAVREVADTFGVVYTPLHGAGYRLVPEVFARMGLKHLYTVDAQMVPNGDFPTVKKPNPEYAEVFRLGIEIADCHGSDLIIATDPDSDRVGVMIRDAQGAFQTVSGNQMGALLLDYAIRRRAELGTLGENPYCIKSIVSTDLAYKIAASNGVRLHDVLTGFKFIGEVIKNYEKAGQKDGFVLGFEESYGYLLGAYARDKDAVGASMMILEMAAYYKKAGMTLADALEKLYERYGLYREMTLDVYMEGLDGVEKRKRVMHTLTVSPPTALGGSPVRLIGDYQKQTVTDVLTGDVQPTGQSSSQVLYYTLENGDKIVVRPSGTEPKIKIYILAHGEDAVSLEAKMQAYVADTKRMTDV